MRIAVSILSFLMILTGVSAQTDTSKQNTDTVPDRVFFINQVERNGEILPEIEIKEVTIIGYQASERLFAAWRYQRLIYNLKKVYPYALIVRTDLSDVNALLEKMPDDISRRKYLRDYEKQIFAEYEDDVRNMTITQGRLLIKLIDRETQNTSYELIKQYRGNFTAAFWQAIARIFGSNLKDRYDRYGEDLLIELIINEIEAGRL
ncbi:MAG TPA: DUF4294 domain-containing protein [Bacteroidales bacterium]|nr:DUF4294 domain-containing protein [Bacteroidales bacterium]